MHAARRLRVVLHVLERHGEGGFALEWRPAGGELVENAPCGVNIGAGVGGFAARLLGGEVLCRADHRRSLGHRRGRIRQGAGDAEVHHLHCSGVGDHDVGGLNVTVDNARFMAEMQSIADLGHHLGGFREPHLALVVDDVP